MMSEPWVTLVGMVIANALCFYLGYLLGAWRHSHTLRVYLSVGPPPAIDNDTGPSPSDPPD